MDVNNPLMIRPKLAYAPCSWLRSIAELVPTACEAVPIDRP